MAVVRSAPAELVTDAMKLGRWFQCELVVGTNEF